jgi:hypothetical protein
LDKYEKADIKEWKPEYYKGDKTRHYLMVDDFVFLFSRPISTKSKDSTTIENVVYPDPESVKYSSVFYSRLKWYADNSK